MTTVIEDFDKAFELKGESAGKQAAFCVEAEDLFKLLYQRLSEPEEFKSKGLATSSCTGLAQKIEKLMKDYEIWKK